MKAKILQNIDNPGELEHLYRQDKLSFKKAFNLLYAEHAENKYFQFWNLRLNYKEGNFAFGNYKEFGFVISIVIIAGLIANISNLPGINLEEFFTKNTVFIIVPFISAYFIWKHQAQKKQIIKLGLIFIFAACYINFLPYNPHSSSIKLSYIHLPIFLWTVLGYTYIGTDMFNYEKRLSFLKYNGDFLIMSAIVMLSCMLFTVITFGLFEIIGFKIENFYLHYIAIWAIGGIPIFATYLINNNPNIINKVSPIIAKIFSPLVFINLLIYIVALVYAGKYPHNDRSLLLIYNALLIGVLALIFFSVAESDGSSKSFYNTILLLGLSILTIIINCIALSAILFRIMEWGITPNRIAVLGGNILIFINLILVSYNLLKILTKRTTTKSVEDCIAKYLPVYAIWTCIVAFLFPLIFNFK